MSDKDQNIIKTACNRLFDLMLRDDGQAYKEAERFLLRHAPDLLERAQGSQADMHVRSLEQQSAAWGGVCLALGAVHPGWTKLAPAAGEAAEQTIMKLAQGCYIPNLDRPSDDDLLGIWAKQGGIWSKPVGKEVQTATMPTEHLWSLLRAIRMTPGTPPKADIFHDAYNAAVEGGMGHMAATAKALRAASTHPTFGLGDKVTKKSGSHWTGKVVGFYSTKLTPEGYAVESSTEIGSVQIYPVGALEAM